MSMVMASSFVSEQREACCSVKSGERPSPSMLSVLNEFIKPVANKSKTINSK